MLMIGGDSSSGSGKVNFFSAASCGVVIGVMLAIILRRDWACVAFDALARKRSTKDCRCARRASCFLASASATGKAGRPGCGEGVVVALIKRQLAVFEVQDRADGAVQKPAVVADDDDGVGIFRKIAFQPERAFEVEVVGRLVQKQQIGGGEEHAGKRHAHSPAAREGRAGHGLFFRG